MESETAVDVESHAGVLLKHLEECQLAQYEPEAREELSIRKRRRRRASEGVT